MSQAEDLVLAAANERKRLSREALVELFERSVTKRLQEGLDGVPIWTKEIQEILPTAQAVSKKVSATKCAEDQFIAGRLQEIHHAEEALNSMKNGLAMFKKLKPENMLLRSGVVDINFANRTYYELRPLLYAGQGRRRALETAVAQIRARLEVLKESSYYNPPPLAPSAIINPPEPEGSGPGNASIGSIGADFDPRGR
jgi:hypothetical protein